MHSTKKMSSEFRESIHKKSTSERLSSIRKKKFETEIDNPNAKSNFPFQTEISRIDVLINHLEYTQSNLHTDSPLSTYKEIFTSLVNLKSNFLKLESAQITISHPLLNLCLRILQSKNLFRDDIMYQTLAIPLLLG